MDGKGDTGTREIYALLLGRWEGEQRALLMSFFSFSHLPSAQNNLYTKVGYFVLQWYIPVPSTTISQPGQVLREVSEFQHEIFLSDEQGPLSQSVALETLSHLETLKPLFLSFQVDRRERGQEPTIHGCKISTLSRIFAKSKRL